MKLDLSQRLTAVRTRLGLTLREVYDRKQLVHAWESAEERHSPTLLHVVEVGSDPLSRPVAREAIEWAEEQIDRAERAEAAARQLSLFAQGDA